MTTLHIRPRAVADLDEHEDYLAAESLEEALRFSASAQETFDRLARQPQIGWQRTFRNPRLSGIRVWRVKGFVQHLIFYYPLDEGADILRVLHGRRDLENILEDELIEGLEGGANGEAQ